jgi:hypothetical protein
MQGGHNDGFIVSGTSYVTGLKSFINNKPVKAACNNE